MTITKSLRLSNKKGTRIIKLKARKTHTIADNDTVKSILSAAFKQTIDAFITNNT